jgi:pimeloyl-ACP methyl ester carboxylesterase
MERSKQKTWFPLLGIPPRKSWVWSWYPRVANYDSRQYWQNLKVPVLLVYGERDRLMPVDTSIATIESILHASGNTNVAAIILPGAPHTLDIEPTSKEHFFWWHVVAGYPGLVIDWIKQL